MFAILPKGWFGPLRRIAEPNVELVRLKDVGKEWGVSEYGAGAKRTGRGGMRWDLSRLGRRGFGSILLRKSWDKSAMMKCLLFDARDVGLHGMVRRFFGL